MMVNKLAKEIDRVYLGCSCNELEEYETDGDKNRSRLHFVSRV